LPATDETSCSSEISVTDHTKDKTQPIKIEADENNAAEGCARTMYGF